MSKNFCLRDQSKIFTQVVKFCLLKNKGFSKLLEKVELKFGEVKSILSRIISSSLFPLKKILAVK